MILDVIQQPNPILKQKTVKITKITAEIKKLAANMVETLYAAHGLGLAAPQISQPIQMIAFDVSEDRDQPCVLINPEIVSHSKTKIKKIEGCLSCRGYEGLVNRYEKITVKGLSIDGKAVTMKTEGLLARVLQHEIDHLNGIMIVDIGETIPPEMLKKLEEEDDDEEVI